MKIIVITGGGTAGHIMPNIALLPELRKHFDKIYYLGTKDSMEERIISEQKDIEFISIPATKLIRKLTIKNLAVPFKLISSICKTKKIIKQIKPNVIFCKGGYVSIPVAIAGKMCKVPVISHESDFSMGLANKIILKFAKVVCTSFSTTASISSKCVFTGSPIREQIYKGRKSNIVKNFDYNPAKKTILFFGGSLGSKKINNCVKSCLNQLCKSYNVLHIVGKNNKFECKEQNYLQVEFANNIEDFFSLADLVICRGGANSLFELLALKKPMLIIPLSKAESRGDQIENAEYFKKHNYADVLLEEKLLPKTLIDKIGNLINNKKVVSSLKETTLNSNNKIVDIILKQC